MTDDHHDQPQSRDEGRWWWRWADLTTLGAFAFAQPLYAVIGENPTFLVAHDLSGVRLVLFALALTFVPAAVLAAADQLVGLFPASVTQWLRLGLRGMLLGLVVGPPVVAATGLDGGLAMAVLAVAVGLGVALFVRLDVMQRLVRYAAFGVPLFLVAFLFLSPASGLLGDEDADIVQVRAAERTSVVWLVYDQLPLAMMVDGDGELVAERFPSFARLAASSTWYPRANTVASSTNLTMTSALSGRFADGSGLPVASQVPVNLFTLLASTHDVHGYETVTQLCPASICGDTETSKELQPDATMGDTWVVLVRTLLPDAVADEFVPETNDRWASFGAEEFEAVVDGAGEATTLEELAEARVSLDDRERFETFLTEVGTSDEPALHYLHMEKPHEPLLFVPDGRIYDRCACYSVDADGRWPEEPAMSRQRLQRYLMQAMHVDRMIGRVLDRLEQTGRAHDTILVVMSDHGASMLPGASNRALTSDNLDEVLPVPLFVRYRGQTEAAVDMRVAQPIDLLPTILDALQITLDDEEFEGRSLLDEAGPDDDVVELIEEDGVERLETVPDPTTSDYVDWIASLYPDPGNPWAQGPAASLVGSPPEQVGTSQLTASMVNANQLDDVDLGTGYVPAHILGELHGAERPVELAAVVNGTVAGVGTSFHKEIWRISLMLDPTYLVEGSNTFELYEVTDAGLLRIGTQ